MRPSEKNKTAQRLSTIRPLQPRPSAAEAIGGLATAALAWLARVLSPVLLKTASVLPAANPILWATVRLPALISSITAARSSRQRDGRVEASRPPPS
jgi:hypothetical protein